jgi:hypothetical protein
MVVFIDSANKYRQKIGALLAAYEELIAIDGEYVAAGIAAGITEDGDILENSDFPDITKGQFTDGVSAAQTVMTTIGANKTNLYIASDGSQR